MSESVLRVSIADEIRETKESLFSVLWDYSTAFMMFGTSLVCFGWLVSPSRFVTRLVQVRRQAIASTTPSLTPGTIPSSSTSVASTIGTIGKPTETPGEREFIRFQHGGHLMCYGEAEKGREVNMDDMKVNLIAGQGNFFPPRIEVKLIFHSPITLFISEDQDG